MSILQLLLCADATLLKGKILEYQFCFPFRRLKIIEGLSNTEQVDGTDMYAASSRNFLHVKTKLGKT